MGMRSTSVCNILRMGKYWYFRFSPTFNPVTGETKYHSYQLLTTKLDLWFELPTDLRSDILNNTVDFVNLKDYGDGYGQGEGYLSVLKDKQHYAIKLTTITKGELTPLTSKVSLTSFAVIHFTWWPKDQDQDDISCIQSISIVWKKASKINPFKQLNNKIQQFHPLRMGELNINLPKVKGTNITNFQSSDELWKAFFEFLEEMTCTDAPRSRRYSFFVPGMSDPIAPCGTLEQDKPLGEAQPQHHINVAQGAPSNGSQPTLVSLLIKAALQQDKYNQRPSINQGGHIIQLVGSLSLSSDKSNFNSTKWVSILKSLPGGRGSDSDPHSTGDVSTSAGVTSLFTQSDPSVYNIPLTDENLPNNPGHLNTIQEKPITYYKAINDYISFFIHHFNINPTKYSSLATIAMAIFRKNFYDPSNTQSKGTIKIGVDKIRDSNIRKAYYGGRIEAYVHKADKGYMYDTNSQYAKAMLNRQPVGHPVEVITETNDFFGFGYYSITTPTSEGPEGLHAPFLPYRHKGDKSFEFITGENLSIHHEDNLEKLLKTLNIDHVTTPATLLFPLGKWTGWYFSEEIKYARTLGYKCTFLQGYTYKEYGSPLAQYANSIYNQRETVAGPYKGIAKLLLNQLYGKFGSQVTSTQGLITNNSLLLSKIKETLIIQNVESMKVVTKTPTNSSTTSYGSPIQGDVPQEQEQKSVYQYINFFYLPNNEYITKEPFSAKRMINEFFSNTNFKVSNIAIAAAISAYARIDIDKIIRATVTPSTSNENSNSNVPVLYYCDTDCVIFSKPLPPQFIGTHLGQMSNALTVSESNFEPYIKDLVCFGPKALSYEVVTSTSNPVEGAPEGHAHEFRRNTPQVGNQRIVKIQGISSRQDEGTKQGQYQISSEQLKGIEPNMEAQTLDLNLRYSLDIVNSLLQKQYSTNPEIGEQEDDFIDWHWDYLVNEWFTYNPTVYRESFGGHSLGISSPYGLGKGQQPDETGDFVPQDMHHGVQGQFEVDPKEELNQLLSLKKRPNISLLNQLEVINTKTEVFKREPVWEKGILVGTKPLVISSIYGKPIHNLATPKGPNQMTIQPITRLNLEDDQVTLTSDPKGLGIHPDINHELNQIQDRDALLGIQTSKRNPQALNSISTSTSYNRNIKVYFDYYDPSLNIYTDYNNHTHLLLKDFTPIQFKDYVYDNLVGGITIQWRKLEEDGSIYSLSYHTLVRNNEELVRTFQDSLVSPATESGEAELKYCKIILKVINDVKTGKGNISWEDVK